MATLVLVLRGTGDINIFYVIELCLKSPEKTQIAFGYEANVQGWMYFFAYFIVNMPPIVFANTYLLSVVMQPFTAHALPFSY
jgi:hypothetical protein